MNKNIRKINKIVNSKHWKVDDIDEDKLKILYEIVDRIENVTQPNIKHLSNLFVNENSNEKIKDFFLEYNKLSPNEKRSRNERNFILYHGEKEGKKKYKEYKNKDNSVSKNAFISRYGKENGEKKYIEYTRKLSDAQKHRVKRETQKQRRERSHFCVEYWIKRGYTEEEAKIFIYEIQSENSKKFHNKREQYGNIYPITIEYWLDRGYSEEDAIRKSNEIKQKCRCDLGSLIDRHGEEQGKMIYNRKKIRQRKSFINRMKEGKIVPYNGSASKESLEYLVPIYKIVRREYDIDRDDIYFGVGGSKEFYIAYGNEYYFLYDFTIRSKKIIIEYNNVRWHPRPYLMNEKEWNGWLLGDMNAEEKYERDKKKQKVAEDKGFKYMEIWNTIPYEDNMKKVKSFLEENLGKR